MDNIFRMGGQVSGDSFIGRKAFIKMLRKEFIENDARMAKSLVGLARTGKTSAVKNAISKDLPDNVLYVYENVQETSNYVELWQDICLAIKEGLEKKNVEMDEMEGWILSITEPGDLPWPKLKTTIKKIFGHLSDAGIKTILVLDEFDAAKTVFGEETKHFELFRTIFSDGDYNVSTVIVSRRKLHTIEGTTYQSSTFHGVLDLVPFQGFDDADMAEYFEVFQKNGIQLSKKKKERILYYAGNIPYLLSIMGHYIIETAKEAGKIDIDDIFQKKCISINDYYRDCIKYLEEDHDLERIVPFLFGPNVGVTPMDKDELVQLGYFREDDGKLVAISEYFHQFLSANMPPVSIWDNIISLEIKLKLLIERELTRIVKHYKAGGNDFDEIFQCVMKNTPGIKKGDIHKYHSYYNKNKRNYPQSNPTYLDTISMGDVIGIMKECWSDVFSEYFRHDFYMDWESKLAKCVIARNPIAHGCEKYLSDSEKLEVDMYCKQIMEMLGETMSEVKPDSESYLEAAKRYLAKNLQAEAVSDSADKTPGFLENSGSPVEKLADSADFWEADTFTGEFVSMVTELVSDSADKTLKFPEHYSPPVEELVGKIVSMKIIGKGVSGHKNLKGVIVGQNANYYEAFIPQNELGGVNRQEKIGGCFQVHIDKIERGTRYMVSPITEHGEWVLGKEPTM